MYRSSFIWLATKRIFTVLIARREAHKVVAKGAEVNFLNQQRPISKVRYLQSSKPKTKTYLYVARLFARSLIKTQKTLHLLLLSWCCLIKDCMSCPLWFSLSAFKIDVKRVLWPVLSQWQNIWIHNHFSSLLIPKSDLDIFLQIWPLIKQKNLLTAAPIGSIHIERAWWLQDMKMIRLGLILKGFNISLQSFEYYNTQKMCSTENNLT